MASLSSSMTSPMVVMGTGRFRAMSSIRSRTGLGNDAVDAAVGAEAADGVEQADHFGAGDAGEDLLGPARESGDLMRLHAGQQHQPVVLPAAWR